MKVGDFLISKIEENNKNITCGDGVVGKFILHKGDKFYINEVAKSIEQFSINYNGTSLWFSYSVEEQYFVEDYKKYFYDYKQTQRKYKLKNL